MISLIFVLPDSMVIELCTILSRIESVWAPPPNLECQSLTGYCPTKIVDTRLYLNSNKSYKNLISSSDRLKINHSSITSNSPAYNVVNKINEMFKYESMMREKEYTKVQIETYRNGEEYQKTIKDLMS